MELIYITHKWQNHVPITVQQDIIPVIINVYNVILIVLHVGVLIQLIV
jgi:hypothetical protein